MVTHNILAKISETAFQLDTYPSKKADRLSNQQHFLTDTVRQCVKVYQLEPKNATGKVLRRVLREAHS